MAFQDFDLISERRKNERQQKIKRRITIAVVSTIVLVLVVAVAVCAVVYKDRFYTNSSQANNAPSTPHPAAKAPPVSPTEKAVKTICASTDYKQTCEDTLFKAVKANASALHPKDLLKASMTAIVGGIDVAINAGSSIHFDDPKNKQAFDVCMTLLGDAKEELNSSISGINENTSNVPDLNNWLSAVMSYQQTCIDGFPDGEIKASLEKALTSAKELTSNSLAMVSLSQVTSFLGANNIKRRLLQKESSKPSLDEEGLPRWMNQESRRILKTNTTLQTPNITVAKDGSGNFTTINAALAAIPAVYDGRYVIYVKEGVYDESVVVTKKMVNLTIYGDGSQKSIITGDKNFIDGVPTFLTATFSALGDGFIAQSIGFRNTAGPEKHQAVALRVQSDRAIFVNCRMEGYQDTLYAQTHRQYYRSCYITGTVDFIFGDAAAIFQNCMIYVRKPMDNQQNIVTAQGRVDKRETTGIVLHSCRILADDTLEPVKGQFKSYLGRPWKEYSRTIIMETEIGDFVHPDGYMPWMGDFALNTLYYAEYNNKGPGAQTTARVKWPGYKGLIKRDEALKYTVGPFIQGESWLNVANVPVRFGLFA
ncbi:hypothetical protein ACH5RR_006275 [Cinchona calisaya]|uniref:Pectinesterase n=1 Tax=Cinchona calisaya TaxID=153742 RepID=A0ABD3ANJ7_9GENT